MIWEDVGRAAISIEHEKRPSPPPVKIRFRDAEQRAVNWKDAFTKLLKQFEESSPGLLMRIATEQTLSAAIATNEDRFRRSKARIGDVYINTHASAAQLQDWCRKVAEIGKIGLTDFEFVIQDDASKSAQ